MLPTVKLFFVAKSLPTRATKLLLFPSIVDPLVIFRLLPSVETEFGSVVPVTDVLGVGIGRVSAVAAVELVSDESAVVDVVIELDLLLSNLCIRAPKLPNSSEGVRLVSLVLI